MSSPEAPVSRVEMDTTDPEQGHQWIRETYTEHRPRISGSSDRFRMRVSGVATDLFRIDDVLHTMSIEAVTAPFGSLFVSRVRGGGFWMESAGRGVRRGPGEQTLMDPARPGRTGWDTLDAQIVVLDLAGARAVAEELSGVPAARVDFGLSVPVDAARARHWARTVDHVAGVLADEEIVAQPLVRAETFRMLAVATLGAFPNTAVDALGDRPPPGSLTAEPAVLRRAVEFVDAHAHRPIGLGDIARAARIGPRGLQHLFRRYRGETPLEYLRRVRLAGAHHDLVTADPTRGDTVGAIAARWGFTHPGRFSLHYRQAHGRSPSDTLRG